MCGGNCKNCPNQKKVALPEERLEPNKKHVVRVQVDTDKVPVGSQARVAIGDNLILVIIVETATDISLEVQEVGD